MTGCIHYERQGDVMGFAKRLKRLEAIVPVDLRTWYQQALDIGRVSGIPRLEVILKMIGRFEIVMQDRRADEQLKEICTTQIHCLIPALKYEVSCAVRTNKVLPDVSGLIAKGFIETDWIPGQR